MSFEPSHDRHAAMPGVGRFMWAAGPLVLGTIGKLAYSLTIRSGPLPDGPFVLAANHFSHFDPPVIGVAIRRPVRFLAVDELADANAPMARILSWTGSIPLSRDRWPVGAVRTALDTLDAGIPVGVFPEATRVDEWGQTPLKRGAAWLSLRAGVPLIPVAVGGTDRVFGVDNKLHRGQISVTVGPAIPGDNTDELMNGWRAWMNAEIGSL